MVTVVQGWVQFVVTPTRIAPASTTTCRCGKLSQLSVTVAAVEPWLIISRRTRIRGVTNRNVRDVPMALLICKLLVVNWLVGLATNHCPLPQLITPGGSSPESEDCVVRLLKVIVCVVPVMIDVGVGVGLSVGVGVGPVSVGPTGVGVAVGLGVGVGVGAVASVGKTDVGVAVGAGIPLHGSAPISIPNITPINN